MTSFSRICALALIAALSLPIATAPASAQTTPLTPMRIANLGFTEASALPVYAQGAGIFKKYGIDATITTFNGGGAIIAAIAGGSLDARLLEHHLSRRRDPKRHPDHDLLGGEPHGRRSRRRDAHESARLEAENRRGPKRQDHRGNDARRNTAAWCRGRG